MQIAKCFKLDTVVKIVFSFHTSFLAALRHIWNFQRRTNWSFGDRENIDNFVIYVVYFV